MQNTVLKLTTVMCSLLLLASACSSGKKDNPEQEKWKKQFARQDLLNEQLKDKTYNIISPAATGAATPLQTGPQMQGDPTPEQVIMATAIEQYTGGLQNANNDSTTTYGPLLERMKSSEATDQFTHAQYNMSGQLLKLRVEEGKENKNQIECVFRNDSLVYLRQKRSERKDGMVTLTQDDFFLQNNQVVFAFRDMGSEKDDGKGGLINMITTDRYQLQGDVNEFVAGAVAKALAAHEQLRMAEKISIHTYVK
jgi:hypothetical protein